MAERDQVAEGLFHRDRVVGGDAREVEVVARGVHQHDRQADVEQPEVVLVGGVGLHA